MFVVLKHCGRNPKINFFNDRKLPTGSSLNRKAGKIILANVLATLKDASAYIFFIMLKKNDVNSTTNLVAITPAQEKLLQFISETEPDFLKEAVRRVKDHVLYFSQSDLDSDDRTACYLMNVLENTLSKIDYELKTN